MARTFKTATMGGGYGTFGSNAKTLRDFVMQSPELLQQIGGQEALDAYIKENQQFAMGGFGGENGLQMSADTQRIDDILNGYQMNSIGYAGMDDGRQKAIVKDGQTLFTGDPYSYKPAKDNLETVMRGAALIGGTAGLSSLVNGGGLLGGASAGEAASGVGVDAAGNLTGSSLMDGALTEAMAGAGSLAPEGVAALIPTGAQLGAIGGGSLLAGGLLGGGMGAAAPAAAATGALDGLKKAGGKVADWAINNPKGAGALLGGLLGGAGGSGGSSGGAGGYTGPMPTITRGDWNANPQAQMMQVPQFGVQMPTKGQKSSGLLRFGG